MVEIQWHSRTKERETANTNFNLHRRASPRPYLGGPGGEIPLGYSTSSALRKSQEKRTPQRYPTSLVVVSGDQGTRRLGRGLHRGTLAQGEAGQIAAFPHQHQRVTERVRFAGAHLMRKMAKPLPHL